MMVRMLYSFILALAAFGVSPVVGRGVVRREVNGVNRHVLFRSRELIEDDCLPPCTDAPTAAPTCPPCTPPLVRLDGPDCPCGECCEACPPETNCQTLEDGGCMCMGCNCGFCDKSDVLCCQMNGGNNNCNPNNSGKWKAVTNECRLQDNRWPSHLSSGNACSGVEYKKSLKYVPVGCGCKPNELTVCSVDISLGDNPYADGCFYCTIEDWEENNSNCDRCMSCIKGCALDTTCLDSANTASQYANCFEEQQGQGNSKTLVITEECRSGCQFECIKNFDMY